MNAMKWWITSVSMVVGLLIVAGGAYRYFREDPRLTEVRQIQDKMWANRSAGDGQRPDREAFAALREKVEALPEPLQKKLTEERIAKFEAFRQQREQEVLDEFFALPPGPQRVAMLDKTIDEEEARRKEWAQRRAQREAERAQTQASAPGDSQGGTPAGAAAAAPATRRGDGSAGGGNNPRRGGWRNMTSEQRKDRARQRADSTTPEHRAQVSEYRRELQERRKERGLPPQDSRASFSRRGA